MKIYRVEGQEAKIPETARDILDILLQEPCIDAINYSTLNGHISLAPYSRKTGRGYGQVTLTKQDFDWLQREAKSQVTRPIDFHKL